MNISLTGQSIGTPMFMPPEQVRVEELTPRSDVYSLGLTLWSALCNQLPYEGDLLQITEQILFHESPSLRDHRADVSYEMEQICLKAISRDPLDRFSDMEAFQSALQTLC